MLNIGEGERQIDEPAEQNCGDTQVARFVGEQLVFVCVMVWLPAPVQLQESGQVTVTCALEQAAVPPAPVHEPVYVVVCNGETDRVPEVPPMVKFVPVQLVALDDVHVRSDDCPCEIVVGFRVMAHVGPTAHV